jgi:hypothetical protein
LFTTATNPRFSPGAKILLFFIALKVTLDFEVMRDVPTKEETAIIIVMASAVFMVIIFILFLCLM